MREKEFLSSKKSFNTIIVCCFVFIVFTIFGIVGSFINQKDLLIRNLLIIVSLFSFLIAILIFIFGVSEIKIIKITDLKIIVKTLFKKPIEYNIKDIEKIEIVDYGRVGLYFVITFIGIEKKIKIERSNITKGYIREIWKDKIDNEEDYKKYHEY
jgi:hypothetical protein